MNLEPVYISGAVASIGLLAFWLTGRQRTRTRVVRDDWKQQDQARRVYDISPEVRVLPRGEAPATGKPTLLSAEARTEGLAKLGTDCDDCGMDHVGDRCPTGLCSMHRYAEDPGCAVCFPLALPATMLQPVTYADERELQPVGVLERAQAVLGDVKPQWQWNDRAGTWEPPEGSPAWLIGNTP